MTASFMKHIEQGLLQSCSTQKEKYNEIQDEYNTVQTVQCTRDDYTLDRLYKIVLS